MSRRLVDLGTAVRISLVNDWGSKGTIEGVVIEVVPRGREPRQVNVWWPDPARFARERYVVQCDGWRALRYRTDLTVVAL